ncbi:MAG: PAS domain S-box-containing protein [Candidatus Azotimanducaceae bacterium]|jgi:PAS domain S-box-containing protein
MLLILVSVISSGVCLASAYLLFRMAGYGNALGIWYYLATAMVLMGSQPLLPMLSATPLEPISVVLQLVLALMVLIGIGRLLPLILEGRSQRMVHEQMVLNMTDIYYFTNTAGLIDFISPSVFTLLGYKPEEVIGKAVSDYFEADLLRTNSRDHLLRTMENNGGSITNYRVTLRHKDGSTLVTEINAQTRHDSAGRLLGIEGIARDITERARVEEELRAQSVILDTLPEGICLVGQYDLTFKWANNRLADMTGYGKEELEGMSALGFLHLSDVDAENPAAIMKIIESEGEWQGEGILIRRDGSLFPGDLRYALLDHPEHGKVLVTMVVDSTSRKQTEAILRESQERYHTLVDNSPYCIYEIDLDGKLISMNSTGLQMMGQEVIETMQGMPFLGCIVDSDRDRVAGLLEAALSGETAEFLFQADYGPKFQGSLVPINDKFGKVLRLLGTGIKITNRSGIE